MAFTSTFGIQWRTERHIAFAGSAQTAQDYGAGRGERASQATSAESSPQLPSESAHMSLAGTYMDGSSQRGASTTASATDALTTHCRNPADGARPVQCSPSRHVARP